MDPTGLDLGAISTLLARRDISSLAVTQACLARIEAEDRVLNCFVTLAAEAAVTDARASDARRARGETRGPLDGVPVAIKDNIDVAGLPTTNGLATRRDAVAATDAEVTRRLRAAGAVILGKLNMHEAALGATTDNPHFGRTGNPHRSDHTPGGSSGGSGAAVAAGFCPAALGTDTLGSVRVPASYCGVAGLKPTPGLVSIRAVAPLSWRYDTVGPLARSVRDLGLLLAALAGFDPECPQSRRAPGRGPATRDEANTGYAVPEDPDVRGLVIGRPRNLDTVPMDSEIRAAWDRALAELAARGGAVRDVEVAGWEPRRTRLAGLLVIEADAAVVHARDLAERPATFSAEVRALLDYGRRLTAARVVEAERAIARVAHAARRVLDDVDVLAFPTTPQTAFPFGTPPPADQADLTALANLAGLPAISLPMGTSRAGLPMGLQLVGRAWDEARLLALGRAWEVARASAARRPS